MMDEPERFRYHIAAAEFFTGDLSQITQDVLFTIAHHYNAAFPLLEQKNHADPAQIQQIVRIYYEAAKVTLPFPHSSLLFIHLLSPSSSKLSFTTRFTSVNRKPSSLQLLTQRASFLPMRCDYYQMTLFPPKPSTRKLMSPIHPTLLHWICYFYAQSARRAVGMPNLRARALNISWSAGGALRTACACAT